MRHARLALVLLLVPGSAVAAPRVPDSGEARSPAVRPVRLAARSRDAARPASGPRASAAPAAAAPKLPPPADLVPALDRAVRIGQLLHRLQRATAQAIAKETEDEPTTPGPPLEGNLALVPSDALARVHFVTAQGPAPGIATTIELPTGAPARLQAFRPPQPLPATEAAMYRAQRTALAASPKKGAARWGRVLVVPAAHLGKTGWAVYLVGEPADEETPVPGGVRVLVGEDGKTVTDTAPLPGSGKTRPGKALLPLHQPATDTPTEIHVLAALSRQRDVAVTTGRGRWVVTGEAIWFGGAVP